MWERFHRNFPEGFGSLSAVHPQEDSMTESPTRPRRRLRLLAPWLAAIVVAAAGAVVFTTPSSAAGPLRNAAAGVNKFIGYAANAALLCNNSAACTSGQDATYRNLAATEFNQVTPENAM